ncbi:MAG: response regulator [Thermoplasmata archaeon]
MEIEHKIQADETTSDGISDSDEQVTYSEEISQSSDEKSNTYDILVVDDETQILKLLNDTLETSSAFECDVNLASDGEYGLKHIKEKDYDIVLSDYEMPEMNGIEFLKKVKEESPETIRMMITGKANIEVAKEAINEVEVSHFIEKPWDSQELISILQEELEEKGESDSRISDVDDVEEAVEAVESVQKSMAKESGLTLEKDKKMIEFTSSEDFNKFSFEIKNKNNIEIDDITIFKNKYVITVGIMPRSFEKIS